MFGGETSMMKRYGTTAIMNAGFGGSLIPCFATILFNFLIMSSQTFSAWGVNDSVSSTFPQLTSAFLERIPVVAQHDRVHNRIETLNGVVSRLASSKDDNATIALFMYSTLGLIDPKLQAPLLSEFEVNSTGSFFSKLSFGMGSKSPSSQAVNLVDLVDLTDIDVQNEDPFTNIDSLKDLVIEFISCVEIAKLSSATWSPAIHTLWLSAIKSPAVTSFSELATLLAILVENLDGSKLQPFWKMDSPKWFNMANEAQNKLEVAALLYSLELMIPSDKFKNSMRWENQRLEWHHALKRFPNEILAPIKEVIRVSYDLPLEEEGHSTAGHKCITDKDKALAEADGSALLFGEFLASGVHRAFDKEHLDGSNALTVYDFGMGLGKLLLQVYLQFPNIKKFVGVELSPSRYELGRDALRRFSSFTGGKYSTVKEDQISIAIEDDEGRLLEFREQNLFDAKEGLQADIIILETHFPSSVWQRLTGYLYGMKTGARLLTYENLHNVFSGKKMPFDQIPINSAPHDRFYTTWSPKRGHHFYLWTRNNVQL